MMPDCTCENPLTTSTGTYPSDPACPTHGAVAALGTAQDDGYNTIRWRYLHDPEFHAGVEIITQERIADLTTKLAAAEARAEESERMGWHDVAKLEAKLAKATAVVEIAATRPKGAEYHRMVELAKAIEDERA